MKRGIIFLLIIFYFLPKSYGENYMRRDMHGFDVIEKIVGWIEDFRDARLRMPETLDELFEILPNRMGMFEIYLNAGFVITYSCINIDTMLVKVQRESDLYECENKFYTYYFYLNGTLTREYTRDFDGELIKEHYYMRRAAVIKLINTREIQ